MAVIFHRVIPLFLSALAPLMAADFPVVPASDRILTVDEVRNFWIHSIKARPLPAESTRLHPDKQATRRRVIAQRRALIEEVKSGQHDLAARLVSLSHNVEAWTRLGDDRKSLEAEQRLLMLREHIAKLATLEAQRSAAVKVGEAADRVTELSGEIQRLKSLLAASGSSG